MTRTTDFIAELFRAGNEVGNLTAFEKRRLLERVANTLLSYCSQADTAAAQKLAEAAARLNTKATIVDQMSNDDAKAALLVAADVIRINRILLGAKD